MLSIVILSFSLKAVIWCQLSEVQTTLKYGGLKQQPIIYLSPDTMGWQSGLGLAGQFFCGSCLGSSMCEISCQLAYGQISQMTSFSYLGPLLGQPGWLTWLIYIQSLIKACDGWWLQSIKKGKYQSTNTSQFSAYVIFATTPRAKASHTANSSCINGERDYFLMGRPSKYIARGTQNLVGRIYAYFQYFK